MPTTKKRATTILGTGGAGTALTAIGSRASQIDDAVRGDVSKAVDKVVKRQSSFDKTNTKVSKKQGSAGSEYDRKIAAKKLKAKIKRGSDTTNRKASK